MGISLGGVLAPRAAAFEKRLAALIANDGVYDFSAAFRSIVPTEKWEPFVQALKAESAPLGQESAGRCRSGRGVAVTSLYRRWGDVRVLIMEVSSD